MKIRAHMLLTTLAAFSLLAMVAAIAGQTASTPSNASANPSFCSAAEYKQFDFWLGDWDVYDVDAPDKVVARGRVDRILDGCVLQEDYQQNDGLRGRSFNHYDSSRKVWHENWVTNRGTMLSFEGAMQSGEMIMNAAYHRDGKEVLVRDTWKPVDGGVRETAVRSSDGGKTWETMFDMIFRPHKQT